MRQHATKHSKAAKALACFYTIQQHTASHCYTLHHSAPFCTTRHHRGNMQVPLPCATWRHTPTCTYTWHHTWHHMPCITRHASHAMHHTPCITRHASHAMHHTPCILQRHHHNHEKRKGEEGRTGGRRGPDASHRRSLDAWAAQLYPLAHTSCVVVTRMLLAAASALLCSHTIHTPTPTPTRRLRRKYWYTFKSQNRQTMRKQSLGRKGGNTYIKKRKYI